MTIWAEAYDLPHLADPGKKIAYLPTLEYRFGKHTDAFREEGSITLPTGFSRLDRVHYVDPDDHTNDVGSVIHLFQRGVLGDDGKPKVVGSFVAERRPDNTESEATSTTQISGRGLTSYFLDRMRLLPFDHPKNPTLQPDWPFGAPEDGGMLADGGFELETLPNGGFEDGSANHWQAESGGIIAVEDAGGARTGLHYGLWNPAADRISRSVTNLVRGKTYTFVGYIKDLGGTGERLRLGVSGAFSASHANAYFDDGEKVWWADLGNVAEGAGSSTGAYVGTTLTFVAGETNAQLFVEYADVNDHNIALDDFDISGPASGVGAWTVSASPGTLNVAEISTEQAHSGASSLKMQGSQPASIDGFGRIAYNSLRAWQDLRLVVGRIYSSTVWVYHTGDDPEYFVARMTRLTAKGPLAPTITGGFAPAPGAWDMAAKYVLVEPDTWTPISLTSIADTDEIRFSIAWAGAYRPTTNLGTLTSPTFYIDDASFYEGLPAVTIGDVWGLIQDDRLPWLIPTFTATEDSNGDPWDTTRSFTLSEGDTWGQIAESFQRLWKYVHRIRYDREDNEYYFDIFNPGYIAVDHSTTDSGSLTVGMNILGGETVTRAPDATDFRVVGEGGLWVEGAHAALAAAWGEADFFLRAPEVGSTDDLTDVLNAAQVQVADQMVTFEAEMGSENQVKPLENIDIFHNIQVNLGGKSAIPTGDRIVTSVVVSGRPGQMPSYQLYANSDAFASTGAAALAEAVRRLLRKKTFTERPKLGGVGGIGGGVGVPIKVAAANSPQFDIDRADFVCSGTNDEQIIQAALDSNGTGFAAWVHLFPGEYFIDEVGVINVQWGSILSGSGDQVGTTLYARTDDATGLPMIRLAFGHLRYITIEDAPGSLAPLAGGGAIETDSGPCDIDHVAIDIATGYGLLVGGSNTTIRDSIIECGNDNDDAEETCVLLDGSQFYADNCEFWQYGSDATYAIEDLRPTTSVPIYTTLTNCFAGYRGGGMRLQWANHVWIDNCYFEGGSDVQHALVLDSVEAAFVSNSVFYDSAWGIRIEGVRNNPSYVKIDKNLFHNLGEGAINVIGGRSFSAIDLRPVFLNITNNACAELGRDYADKQDVGAINVYGELDFHETIDVGASVIIANNQVEDAIYMDGIRVTGVLGAKAHDNLLTDVRGHGIVWADTSEGTVHGNTVKTAGFGDDNTYDGLRVEGDSNGNVITDNKVVIAPTLAWRYGIHIVDATCDDNVVHANSLGDPADYGTGDFLDGGTGTITHPGANGQFNAGGGSLAAAPGIIAFSQSDDLVTGDGTFQFPFPFDATLVSVIAAVGTAPTGDDIILDVELNGASIYPTSPKPTIVDASEVSALAPPDTTAVSAGDLLTVNIDQIGSGTPGSDLTVAIHYQ